MATITIWRDNRLLCRMVVQGKTYTLQLVQDEELVRQENLDTPDRAIELAQRWQADLPLTKLQATLASLNRAR
jgi:ATP-dependent protease HslVU (ClpYQ) peptidase subunit